MRPAYEIKKSSTFMEYLRADFVQFSSAFAKFLFLEIGHYAKTPINFYASLKFPHFLRS